MALCRRAAVDVLEPSAGDGAFFRNLPKAVSDRIRAVTAVEIDPTEALKCRDSLRNAQLHGTVSAMSFLKWAMGDTSDYDVVVGNPPFVRFQFVSGEDVASANSLFDRAGLRFEGVSNLWIPVLLGALSKLRPGGSAALVVPAELFTGMTAGLVREWLVREMDDLSVDLFPCGKFPGVLQEVIVLSGVRRETVAAAGRIRVANHDARQEAREWIVDMPVDRRPWTRLLLAPEQIAALDEALAMPDFVSLRTVARLQVSIVTGANEYFSLSSGEIDRLGLRRWAVPLLPRIRHATGLVWTTVDQRLIGADVKAWLLDFSATKPSPKRYRAGARYIELGEAQGLHTRYKCRIREPWYRVPDIETGTLMLSKRSHRIPRLVLNRARAYTTDTIYRGRMLTAFRGRERDFVAGFHNSVTLLTSELEGRSFGGGVHELVPSEIGRLFVPMIGDIGAHLGDLDALSRRLNGEVESLIAKTNELVLRNRLSAGAVDLIEQARQQLMRRRLERGSSSFDLVDSDLLAG